MEGEPDREFNEFMHEVPRHIRITPWAGNPPEPTLTGDKDFIDAFEEETPPVPEVRKTYYVKKEKRIELRHPDGRVVVYAGIRLAAEELGVTYGAVRYSLVKGYSVQGWKAYTYSGPVIPPPDKLEKRVPTIGFKSGEHKIWESRMGAAEHIGVSPQNVRYSVKYGAVLKGWRVFDYIEGKSLEEYDLSTGAFPWMLTKGTEVVGFLGISGVARFLEMSKYVLRGYLGNNNQALVKGWEVKRNE